MNQSQLKKISIKCAHKVIAKEVFVEPLNFPLDESRKSIILYYYTKESRPANQSISEKPHSIIWVKSSLKDKRGNSL